MGKPAQKTNCKCDKCLRAAALAKKFNPSDLRREPTNTTSNTRQNMRSCNDSTSCSFSTSSRTNSSYPNSSMVNLHVSDRSPISSFTNECFSNNHDQNNKPCQPCVQRNEACPCQTCAGYDTCLNSHVYDTSPSSSFTSVCFSNNHNQNNKPCQHCVQRYEACPCQTCAGYDKWQPQYIQSGDQGATDNADPRSMGRGDSKRNQSATDINMAYNNRSARTAPKSKEHWAQQRSAPCYPTTTGQKNPYTPMENQYHQTDQHYERMQNYYKPTDNPYKPTVEEQYYPKTGQPRTIEAQSANEIAKRKRKQELSSRRSKRKRTKLMTMASECHEMPGPSNNYYDTRQNYSTTVLAENNANNISVNRNNFNNNDEARAKRIKKRGKKKKGDNGFCVIL